MKYHCSLLFLELLQELYLLCQALILVDAELQLVFDVFQDCSSYFVDVTVAFFQPFNALLAKLVYLSRDGFLHSV